MTQTTQSVVKVSGIDHVVLQVRDVERAKQFYIDVLGLTLDREHGKQSFLRCGPYQVGLFESPEGAEIHAGDEMNHLALRLEWGDFEQVSAALKAAGVAFKGREGDPYCIYLEDPDGHLLQLLTTDHGQRRRQHGHHEH
jgi:catechol 2,3-dioxygenase-like lactoylglutathione lyase family enzyme